MESNCLLSKQSHTSVMRNNKRKAKSSIQDSRTPIKKKRAISKDEKKTYAQNKPSSTTMVPVSSRPFWNAFTNKKSQELWSATKSDCVDSDLKLMNGSFKKQTMRSWFSVDLKTSSLTSQTNWQKSCCLSSTSLCHEIMDSVTRKSDEKRTTSMKAKKIEFIQTRNKRTYYIIRWLGVLTQG